MISAVTKLQKKHLQCLYHELNTIIRNAISKKVKVSSARNEKDVEQFVVFVDKCKIIVGFLHHSTNAKRVIRNIESKDLEEGDLLSKKFAQMVLYTFYC